MSEKYVHTVTESVIRQTGRKRKPPVLYCIFVGLPRVVERTTEVIEKLRKLLILRVGTIHGCFVLTLIKGGRCGGYYEALVPLLPSMHNGRSSLSYFSSAHDFP